MIKIRWTSHFVHTDHMTHVATLRWQIMYVERAIKRGLGMTNLEESDKRFGNVCMDSPF